MATMCTSVPCISDQTDAGFRGSGQPMGLATVSNLIYSVSTRDVLSRFAPQNDLFLRRFTFLLMVEPSFFFVFSCRQYVLCTATARHVMSDLNRQGGCCKCHTGLAK